MILPSVTGNRFFKMNPEIDRFPRFGMVFKMSFAAVITAGSFFSRSPAGMKYILAIECSNPKATNAVMGNRIAKILSVTDRPLKQRYTAKQTKILQRMPLDMACPNVRLTLLFAIIIASTPTVAPPAVLARLVKIKNVMRMFNRPDSVAFIF